jgi:hypothetical protein
MTAVQLYLVVAPLVVLAIAGAYVWFTVPPRSHRR